MRVPISLHHEGLSAKASTPPTQSTKESENRRIRDSWLLPLGTEGGRRPVSLQPTPQPFFQPLQRKTFGSPGKIPPLHQAAAAVM